MVHDFNRSPLKVERGKQISEFEIQNNVRNSQRFSRQETNKQTIKQTNKLKKTKTA